MKVTTVISRKSEYGDEGWQFTMTHRSAKEALAYVAAFVNEAAHGRNPVTRVEVK
jgi:hypothetical protein